MSDTPDSRTDGVGEHWCCPEAAALSTENDRLRAIVGEATPGIDAPVGDGADIGRITCYKLDEGWIPVIAIGKEEVDLEPLDGPGAAVDAAHKWARDRGLILTFPSMVIRRKP